MLRPMKRIGVVGILVLAFLGLADSAYVALQDMSGAPLLCSIENLSGCNIVAASPYSDLFGIPIAQYGVLFYAALFALAALELVVFDRLLRRILQGFAVVGILASVIFTLIQVFLIEALCIYCLASAVITVLILACASVIEPVRRTMFDPENEPPPAPPPFSMPMSS